MSCCRMGPNGGCCGENWCVPPEEHEEEELIFLATFIGNGQCEGCDVKYDNLMLYHSNNRILCDDCAGY